MWSTSTSPPAPTPRLRGVSVGSSSLESAGSHLYGGQFARHTKERLSAGELSSRLALTLGLTSPLATSSASSGDDSTPQGDTERNLRGRRSDPLANDDFYTAQLKLGNFVKMGWLTKQGHTWCVRA